MTELDMGMGPINGPIVAHILKEHVRRAIDLVNANRNGFAVHAKPGYSEGMEDVFTDIDPRAQEIYLRAFTECFPNAGVIGEEKVKGSDKPLFIAPKNGCRAYFTIDPIDGTRAFIRQQSHGIATMVALVHDNEVISAYIGDVCANETYGYRPGSNHVWRIRDLRNSGELHAPSYRPAEEMFVLLRDPPHEYDLPARKLIPRFKNHEVMGSSIGTWMARLWKQEVGAMLLPAGAETPWDSTPVIGISLKLGYVFMRPNDRGGWEVYEPELPTQVTERNHDSLIVHRNSAAQFVVQPVYSIEDAQ